MNSVRLQTVLEDPQAQAAEDHTAEMLQAQAAEERTAEMLQAIIDNRFQKFQAGVDQKFESVAGWFDDLSQRYSMTAEVVQQVVAQISTYSPESEDQYKTEVTQALERHDRDLNEIRELSQKIEARLSSSSSSNLFDQQDGPDEIPQECAAHVSSPRQESTVMVSKLPQLEAQLNGISGKLDVSLFDLEERLAGMEQAIRLKSAAEVNAGSSHESTAKLSERLSCLETELRELSGKFSRALSDVHKELSRQPNGATMELNFVEERIERLEGMLAESSCAQDKMLGELMSQNQHTQDLHKVWERHAGDVTDLKATLAVEVSKFGADILTTGSLIQRVNSLEEDFYSTRKQHSGDIAQLKGGVADEIARLKADLEAFAIVDRIGGIHGELESINQRSVAHAASLEEGLRARAEAHTALEELVSGLCEDVKRIREQRGSEVAEFEACLEAHAVLARRVSHLEEELQSIREQHSSDIGGLETSLQAQLVLSEHVNTFEEELRSLQVSLDVGLKAHTVLEERVGGLQEEQAALPARFCSIAQELLDSTGSRAREVASLASSQARHVQILEAFQEELRDRMSQFDENLSLALSNYENTTVDLQNLRRSSNQTAADMSRCCEDLRLATEKWSWIQQEVEGTSEKHVAALEALRSEHCQEFALAGTRQSAMEGRVASIEQSLGEALETHMKALTSLQPAFDKHVKDLATLRESHIHHASISERVSNLEVEFAACMEKIGRALTDAQQVDKSMNTGLDVCKELTEIRAIHNEHAQSSAAKLCRLEEQFVQVFGCDGEKQTDTMSMQAKHSALEECFAEFRSSTRSSLEFQAKLLMDLTGDREENISKHASMAERVDCVERELSDVAEKNAASIDGVKQETTSSLSLMAERLEYIKRELGDVAKKHVDSIDGARKACERYAIDSAGFAASEERLADLLAQVVELRESKFPVLERLTQLELNLEGSIERQAKLSADAEAELQEVADRQARAAETDLQKAEEAVLLQEARAREWQERYSSMLDRLGQIELRLEDFIRRQDSAFGDHAKELQRRQEVMEEHAERMEKTAAEHFSHDNKLLADFQREVLMDLTGDREENISKHASISERLDCLERELSGVGEKHAASIDGVKKESISSYASMNERLEYLRRELGDLAEKHVAGIDAARKACERYAIDYAGFAASEERLADLLAQVVELRESKSSMLERLTQLELNLEDSIERQAKLSADAEAELQEVADSQARAAEADLQRAEEAVLLQEARAREWQERYSSMLDRLGQIELRLEDFIRRQDSAFGDHARELQRKQEAMELHVERMEKTAAEHLSHNNELLADFQRDLSCLKEVSDFSASMSSRICRLEQEAGAEVERALERLGREVNERMLAQASKLELFRAEANATYTLCMAKVDRTAESLQRALEAISVNSGLIEEQRQFMHAVQGEDLIETINSVIQEKTDQLVTSWRRLETPQQDHPRSACPPTRRLQPSFSARSLPRGAAPVPWTSVAAWSEPTAQVQNAGRQMQSRLGP